MTCMLGNAATSTVMKIERGCLKADAWENDFALQLK